MCVGKNSELVVVWAYNCYIFFVYISTFYLAILGQRSKFSICLITVAFSRFIEGSPCDPLSFLNEGSQWHAEKTNELVVVRAHD